MPVNFSHIGHISENEMRIIETLRTLKPFEEIKITADKQGKVNNYFVLRSTKVILTDNEPIPVA